MTYFQTKVPNLGKFCRALHCKLLEYLMAFWYRYFVAIWYILWLFGTYILWPLGISCGYLAYFSPFW
jgi:hypothetical protein